MTRFRLSHAKSSTNLLLIAIAMLALMTSGSVAYAWSQGASGGCGESASDSSGGGCPSSFELIWTSPSGTTYSSPVLCTLGGLGSSTLTVTVSRVGPGQSCLFNAALENAGETPLSITEQLPEISQPANCFVYSDNVPTGPLEVIVPGHPFDYAGTISLTGPAESAGNACEGARATIDVTIIGTEYVTHLTAPTISVSPTTLYSGQTATLTTTTSFSGGESPYTCQWLVEAPSKSSYSHLGSSFSCSPGALPTVSTGTLTTGTWRFELSVTDGEPATVTSNSVSVTVNSKPTAYSVTFSESGLPSGLSWKVTVNGVTMSLTTNGATDSLSWTGLASGTYAYSIAGNSGWHQSTLPYAGSVVVSGASVTEPTLLYKEVTYSVTFTESGLPGGTSWSVTMNGVTDSTTGKTITFSEPNGTYAYTVGPVSGCNRSPTSGTVTVNGAAVSVTVTIKKA
jgi:hypothetical protein